MGSFVLVIDILRRSEQISETDVSLLLFSIDVLVTSFHQASSWIWRRIR